MYNYKKCVLYVTCSIIFSFSFIQAMDNAQNSITDPKTVMMIQSLPQEIQKKILFFLKQANTAIMREYLVKQIRLAEKTYWTYTRHTFFRQYGTECLDVVLYCPDRYKNPIRRPIEPRSDYAGFQSYQPFNIFMFHIIRNATIETCDAPDAIPLNLSMADPAVICSMVNKSRANIHECATIKKNESNIS